MKFIKTNFQKIAFFIALTLLSSACAEEVKQSLKPVPQSFGRINQLVFLADQNLWDSHIKDTIEYYYGSAFPILPQPEPVFDIRHYTPEDLKKDPPRKNLRNFIILANLNDKDSPATQLVLRDIGAEKALRAKEDPSFHTMVGHDKWAKGQIVVYQFAYSIDDLVENIIKSYPTVAEKLHNAGKDVIEATVYQGGVNAKLKQEIKDQLGAEIRIPGDYFKAINDGDIIWARKETRKLSSNLILRKVAYEDESQLSKEEIKSIRNKIGRKYISSTEPGSYMVINDIDLPLLSSVKTINNNYALEARGIWELENDFMGGPFISYLIHNPQKGELLFIDGFVYAPGERKREYMQHLEHIISSVRF